MATSSAAKLLHNEKVYSTNQKRANPTFSDSSIRSFSARHVDNESSNQCRFAYATWCPVCENQKRSKTFRVIERRRSKSEGMDGEKSESYYYRAPKNESCLKKSLVLTKEPYVPSKPALYDEYVYDHSSFFNYSPPRQNICSPLQTTSDHHLTTNKNRVKSLYKSSENHVEPNRVCYKNWNDSSAESIGSHKENDPVPLHERYYYEVEMLRNKLHTLKGSPKNDKSNRCFYEVEKNSSTPLSLEVGTKRPRDFSPSAHMQSSVRKLLPVVPNSKCCTYKTAMHPREHCVLSSGSSTPVSSDSEYNDSGCEEEEGMRYDSEVDYEEDQPALFGSLKINICTTDSSTHPVHSSSVGESGSLSASNVDPGKIHPALRASLFSHVPPFIKFSSHETKGPDLPTTIQKLLKWKLSTITPVVVRKTILNSNFKLVRKSNEWCGTWGKHMKSLCFKTLREYQKINHFPGTFQIGRKDRLWKNLYRLIAKFGKKEFGFIPRTYVLPQDNKLLRSAWEKNCGKERWIVKPPASARGTGIKVIHKWTQIPKKCPLVVQKYISDPYLINGSKFDLRLYVLVTSINPMRIYLYDNGLVRFASVKYSNEMTSLADRYMHLTNYSINKLSSQYTQNEDASACQGHKWSLQAMWTYLEKEQNVDVKGLWSQLIDLVIKTIISGESAITQLSQANLASRYCSYELFGVDVLLDHYLKPWLLEVNISPSLHSSSPLDLAVKGPLVQDLMNIAGYQIPAKLSSQVQSDLAESLGCKTTLCYDRRLYTTALSNEERLKHVTFQQSEAREDYLDAILQDLTPDDIRHLIQYEDELTQIGSFQKVFPTTETNMYHQFFEAPRYYNMLFDAWEVKQSRCRAEGISLLESLCQKCVHLDTTQIPPKRTKVSMNLNENSLENPEPNLPKEVQEVYKEDTQTTAINKIREKWNLSLSCGMLCRAARPRSGKPGVVTKPYPRSSYTPRLRRARSVTSATVSVPANL